MIFLITSLSDIAETVTMSFLCTKAHEMFVILTCVGSTKLGLLICIQSMVRNFTRKIIDSKIILSCLTYI